MNSYNYENKAAIDMPLGIHATIAESQCRIDSSRIVRFRKSLVNENQVPVKAAMRVEKLHLDLRLNPWQNKAHSEMEDFVQSRPLGNGDLNPCISIAKMA
jgi:hypothetical protein